MTIAGLIIGLAWTFSVIFAHRMGFVRGWDKGHEDTKNATYKVIENCKRKIEEQARKKE
ncbi:hypothetical protein [Sporosarcina sp. P18a]|uniref:hypothetical protein n=1 Tax=Sporosarcina sp. P18a TaxID=2048259 RepID=UPI0013046539|nr:hypothetical protein [Sporosarcina sp. P18a]